MSRSVAVFYKRDGFDTDGTRLLGRHAAGEGFLKALVRDGTAEPLYCYTSQRQEFTEFCDRIRPWLTRPRSVEWLSDSNPQLLSQAGIFYRPDAAVVDLAWQRRFLDQRGYSICGLTHTIASKETLKMIGDLLTAPVQPWDALICTSTAVKVGIDRLLDNWADYLVNVIFVNGRQKEIRTRIWSAADIFISLADNIQETFGLTPIEAMAAGLPVVVSEWNGYRDTVRHEVDGFLIPTIMPPIGTGIDLAAQYFSNQLNYSTYVGQVSIVSAIDVNACAHALEQLITQP